MSIRLNPDSDFVKEIKKQLKDNSGYCPCVFTKRPEDKCICKEFKEMESGTCHCGLYIKE